MSEQNTNVIIVTKYKTKIFMNMTGQIGQQNKREREFMNELYLQKVINLLREQLGWEIPKEENFYKHVVKCIESLPKDHGLSEEKFVEMYRLQFKPGYPNDPLGGIGEEGDMFIIIEPKIQVMKVASSYFLASMLLAVMASSLSGQESLQAGILSAGCFWVSYFVFMFNQKSRGGQ